METPASPAQTTVPCEPAAGSLWTRALLMVFFAIVTRIVEFVVVLVMVAQFIAKLATGRTVAGLMDLGERLSRYAAEIIRFQTFNTEARPYPFGSFPHADSGAGAEGGDKAPPKVTPESEHSTGTTPNPA